MKSTKMTGKIPDPTNKPLDGSQYLNVIEEQIYSELPPSQEEQQPLRVRHLEKPQAPHPHDSQISVGTT